jgi:uncharacterized protein
MTQQLCFILLCITTIFSIFSSEPPVKRQCIRQAFDHTKSLKLIEAAKNGKVSVVRELLQQPRIDVNICDKRHLSPLIWAAKNGHLEVVGLLLNTNKTDINSMGAWGETPLNRATYHGYSEIVQLLLIHGADINFSNCLGRTALHYVLDTTTLQILLKNGADTKIENEKNDTPLQSAIKDNHPEIAQGIKNYIARKETLSFLCAFHPRLGIKSPAREIPHDNAIIMTIFDMLRF